MESLFEAEQNADRHLQSHATGLRAMPKQQRCDQPMAASRMSTAGDESPVWVGTCRPRPVEAAADGAPPTTQGLARRATGNVRQPPMYSGPTPGRTTNGRLRRRLPFNRQTRPAAASLKQWFGSAGRTLAHGLERRRRTAANQHHQFGRLVPVGEIGGSAVSPRATRGSRNHGCILPTDWPPPVSSSTHCPCRIY